MVDRQRPAKDMMRLIQLLSGHKASGLTVKEIAARMETSPRTVHRYLAALHDIEPDLASRLSEDSQEKIWFLPSTRTRLPPVTAEQLSSLTAISKFMHAHGQEGFAQTLTSLRDSLQAGLDRTALMRIEPDLEVLDASIEVTHRPGPKSAYDPQIRTQLLKAITCELQIEFRYTDVRGRKTSTRRVSPYALVAGPRAYLIGREHKSGDIRNFAMHGIRDITELESAAPRRGFDARSYVAQSFGAFHDGEFHQWVLRFKPSTAHELKSYQFHPSQTMTTLHNGEVEVSFRCESIREVAYECFRWSEHLSWIGPIALQDTVTKICNDIKAACSPLP